jgi:hypothetical protein
LTKLAGGPKNTGQLVSFSALAFQERTMLLDNLFSMLGVPGTVAILFGIVSFLGFPAAATIMCPKSAYTRLQRSR